MKPIRLRKDGIFSAITHVDSPRSVTTDPESGRSESFRIKFKSNGDIPFPQVIIRSHDGEHIFKGESIKKTDDSFTVSVPKNELPPGNHQIQIEGCRKKDWLNSGGNDWIKWFGEISVEVLQTVSGKKKLNRL